MTFPTNEVLATKLDNLTGIVERIEVHTKETNGQVRENTDYRLQHKDLMKNLGSDRENKLKRYSDLIWKLGTTTLFAVWGISKIL